MKIIVLLAVIVCVQCTPTNLLHKLSKFTLTAEKDTEHEGSTHSHTHPPYCKKWDCPHYKSENDSDLFETRMYEETPWVGIEGSGYFLSSLMMKTFYPLFNYITGKNDEKRSMGMTVPVMTAFSDLDHSPVKANVHFYMPLSYGKLPKPLDSRLTLSSTSADTKFYVRVFDGYVMTLSQIRKQRNALLHDLKAAGMKFDKSVTYFASYNKPTTWKNRHNEVWIAASKK